MGSICGIFATVFHKVVVLKEFLESAIAAETHHLELVNTPLIHGVAPDETCLHSHPTVDSGAVNANKDSVIDTRPLRRHGFAVEACLVKRVLVQVTKNLGRGSVITKRKVFHSNTCKFSN